MSGRGGDVRRPEPVWEEGGCLICGEPPDDAPVVAAFPQSSYRRCVGCDLVFLSPRLREADMLALYRGGEYYLGDAQLGYDSYLEDEAAYRKTFQRRLAEIGRHRAGGRLLDVGCGAGWLVEAALALGYDAVGLDVSGYARAREGALAGRVHAASLEDAGFEAGSFDVVTLMDVFEHLYDPIAEARRLARLLAPGGVVAIATPDYDSWMRRLLGRRSVSFKIPEHVAYYTRATLARAVAGVLRVISVQAIGQYCTPAFVTSRLASVLGLPIAGIHRVVPEHWMPYVPSGSLLAILEREDL